MNINIIRALFRDAFAQVVDNMMFRILVGLLMFCVLPTFLIGFGEESLTILFYWRFPYDELLQSFGGSGTLSPEMRIDMIQGMQALLVDVAAGKMGILLSIAATAFFVPRMLERGAADTLFSKPVSRLALLLSRYFAGLIFVSILAVLLVGGMHLGFLVSSGYSDPGFLWSILTLIYIYSVMHAVSIMIGVFTRSSVAAILLTMIFFMLNSCVHGLWEGKESGAFGDAPQTKAEAEAEPVAAKEEGRDMMDWLVTTSDVLHYTLPKTGDASRMAKILRLRIEDQQWELADTGRTDLSVAQAPEGFERDPRSSLTRDGVLWTSSDAGRATLNLSLRPMLEVKSRVTEGRRFLEQLEQDASVTIVNDGRRMLAERRAEFVEWHEERDGEQRLRRQWLFQARSEWLLTLSYDAELEWAGEEQQEEILTTFMGGFFFPEDLDPFQTANSYSRKFGFDAEWKYNAWFSIATTLAFLLVMLLMGWWKLTRIDF